MGKNNGKHREKTEYAKFQSIMAKLDNEINNQTSKRKKPVNIKSRGEKDEFDE